MFKPNAVAYWNPSSSCIMPDFFGIEYSFQIKYVFGFLKYDIVRTVPFVLGTMNVGQAQALNETFPV